jgi:uncharacterized protein (DUF1697 family)
MPTCVALLRGVNVGQNMLKMERLRALCEELDAKSARTYVQSGNVVFEGSGSASHWATALERKLAGETRLPVSVIVRTAAELSTLLAGNPFLEEKGIDLARLGVVFLQQPLSKAAIESLNAMKIGRERFHCAAKEIYIHCPDGFGRSKLYLLDKVVAQRTTTRNWNTVKKLCEMCTA